MQEGEICERCGALITERCGVGCHCIVCQCPFEVYTKTDDCPYWEDHNCQDISTCPGKKDSLCGKVFAERE